MIDVKLIFRVREYTRLSGYWVYCSGEFNDYYTAIKFAIEQERKNGIHNWVECVSIDDIKKHEPD